MRSFRAIRAQSSLSDRNSSGADQLCRRMLRHAGASDCLCGGSGAACHRRPPSLGPIAGGDAAEPAAKAGWSVAARSYPAFAVSQFDLSGKTETYEIFRHPEGGRKDVFRWAAQGEKPVAELEIYRPGGEFGPSGPAIADIAARMDPEGTHELEAAGVIDSKFGTRDAASPAGTPTTRLLPRLHQALRRARSADLRLVVPGRRIAGPARGDRLHAEPADPAHGRKRPETGRIVRPRRAQARQLRAAARQPSADWVTARKTRVCAAASDRRRRPRCWFSCNFSLPPHYCAGSVARLTLWRHSPGS